MQRPPSVLPDWGLLPTEIWAQILEAGVKECNNIHAQLARLIQLSTVCSRFKDAVVCTPSLKSRHWSHYESIDHAAPRLNSQLLLSWAPHMTAMEYDLDRTYTMPGVFELTSAARNVTMVKMDCGHSQLTAAYADHLLARLPSVSELSVWGYYLPSCFPVTLTELRFLVGLPQGGFDSGLRPPEYEDVEADALLWRLGRLPQLQRLAIKFMDDVTVSLTCPVNLPRLSRLFLRFYCTGDEDESFDLAWVHRQPVDCLDVQVHLCRQTTVQHVSLLQRLEGLRIHSLTLTLWAPFLAEHQALWSLSACTMDKLYLKGACQDTLDPLAVLPTSCAEVTVDGRRCFSPMRVEWGALTQRPASIRIIMSDKWTRETHDLHLLGDCNLACMRLARQPWQLVVCSKGTVHGLPGGVQPQDHVYLLQNDAACAAGWTADKSRFM